jgi:hypothetical protein
MDGCFKGVQSYSSLFKAFSGNIFSEMAVGGRHPMVAVRQDQSRSVAPGRAWSRPFRKKKIVYFFGEEAGRLKDSGRHPLQFALAVL